MADPLRRTTPGAARSGLLGLLLLMPAAAHATPCADIYKLAEVGVSGELLEKAINANAENMSEEVANCLEQLDVPFSVIKLVRDAAAESAASAGRDSASTPEAADARSAPAAGEATAADAGAPEPKADNTGWLSDVPDAPVPVARAPEPVPETVPAAAPAADTPALRPVQIGAYSAATVLVVSGVGLLASTLPARQNLRDGVIEGAVPSDEAQEDAAPINRRVTVGYGCLALGAGVAGSTAALLSVGAGGATVSLGGVW